MKYIKQFSIILLISFVGEILHDIIPLPIPSSIYGIIILFAALEFKILHVGAIKETSVFLIEIMPVMFIPSAVGLMASWDILGPAWQQYLVITVVSTFAVMIASGKVTQMVIGSSEKSRRNENE